MQNFWAFAAIFIIASYTANLAAFIAGKHAGINYVDIKDQRVSSLAGTSKIAIWMSKNYQKFDFSFFLLFFE